MRTLLLLATGQPEKNRKALEHSAKLRHNNNFDQSVRTGKRNLLLITILAVFLLTNIIEPLVSKAIENSMEAYK